ncbi:MAG: quinone-dependent dihydroorotate dehydrogenase [Candidatus Binatia bacterium]
MIYKTFVRPLLFLGDAEKTHEQTLAILSKLGFMEDALERLYRVEDERLRVRLGSLSFPNPVGLAAGFDKNGRAIETWPGFGFGFIEIGAVTARPQPGNPKPRLFRLPKDRALINRLGFNNDGAEAIASRLKVLKNKGKPVRIPIGINIGRTKIVENKDAVADYLFTFETLYRYGDYFTLNVSSPNTPNLRELQGKSYLLDLLGVIQAKNQQLAEKSNSAKKPVLVKIAPDMELTQVDEIIEVILSRSVDGVIATNASAFLREGLTTRIHEPGGLSGQPLRARATSFIQHIYKNTEGKLPIIGSGGIFTAEDAYEKITAGATAVQVYTGFVYEGPGIVKEINRGLLRLMERDRLTEIAHAVGIRCG